MPYPVLKDAGRWEYMWWLLRRRRRVRVKNNSMLPTLKPGDTVLVNPHAQPAPGDIVLARHPLTHLEIVKRVAAITDNGSFILIGDNHAASTDSRAFGPVASTQILGRVTGRFG